MNRDEYMAEQQILITAFKGVNLSFSARDCFYPHIEVMKVHVMVDFNVPRFVLAESPSKACFVS